MQQAGNNTPRNDEPLATKNLAVLEVQEQRTVILPVRKDHRPA